MPKVVQEPRLFPFVRSLTAIIATLLSAAAIGLASAAETVPMIDAHSQADRDFDLAGMLALANQAGVRHTILSSRGGLKPDDLVAMALAHPERITASMGVKSKDYIAGSPKFFRRMDLLAQEPGYGAISEALLWHKAKGPGAASPKARQRQANVGRQRKGPRRDGEHADGEAAKAGVATAAVSPRLR
jgi:hypothetical protein